MQEKIERPGGTVVREAPRKWNVTAPDGRPVGSFPSRKLALAKAEHWDKWDAFNSLAEIFACMAPLTFLLTTQSLLTITDKEPFIPTEEQMTTAMVFDYIIALGREHPEILEKLKENPELLREILDKIKEE